uniref:Uncharacterized protein n=1 Tax=Knipowitschia caucasica TaxID=637954 RepID=A0AAV2L6E1_KNICA
MEDLLLERIMEEYSAERRCDGYSCREGWRISCRVGTGDFELQRRQRLDGTAAERRGGYSSARGALLDFSCRRPLGESYSCRRALEDTAGDGNGGYSCREALEDTSAVGKMGRIQLKEATGGYSCREAWEDTAAERRGGYRCKRGHWRIQLREALEDTAAERIPKQTQNKALEDTAARGTGGYSC